MCSLMKAPTCQAWQGGGGSETAAESLECIKAAGNGGVTCWNEVHSPCL